MSSFLSTGLFKGLLAGFIVPPIVAKFVIIPYMVDPNFLKEIHYIQQEVEYVGWTVRHLQEDNGFKEEDMYRPASFVNHQQV
ncbi:uncharacterized protein J8A68_000179 [[Candida] subhashii]|uniref:Uncharacterized protein n=1 Tax=[Candida] subhashii TaxID=561895 RepID=A0A8J5QIM7_9ASCO|nr:uncharacterized protein J8A68_000179 [[Candida] subhashii]KAG7666284.1 hypothetical protein J8A68_000179 [[Candida] subhashii]